MKNDHKMIGTLIPLSSLQSTSLQPEDNGTFAVGGAFLKWLKETNQSAWQMLPLHETQLEHGSVTKHVPSPYKSYGVGLSPTYLDSTFAKKVPSVQEKQEFLQKHKSWIGDYILFCSLRDHFKTDDWRLWDAAIRNYQPEARLFWQEKLQKQMTFYLTQQWQLHESYKAMKDKARQLDILLIGDLPFYPSLQSPLVWAHQEDFQINPDGSLPFVSGIPDMAGTHFGRQIWGHPLYQWEKQSGVVAFWKLRLDYLVELFDWVRFDHVRGFFSYGEIDPKNESRDIYRDGPGGAVLEALVAYSHTIGLHIFVEDSGEEVPALRVSLAKLNIPGIKVIRFMLKNINHSVHFGSEQTVAYTTTHDTETLIGYLHKVKPYRKQLLAKLAYVNYSPYDKIFAVRLRDGLLASRARMILIPMQDWLLLKERINIPGTERAVDDPNWRFRLKIPVEKLPHVNR